MKNGPFALTFHTCFIVFLIAPIVVVCLVAFTPTTYLSLPTTGFSLRWFREMLGRPDFIEALRTSAVLGAVSATVAVAIAIPSALAVTRFDFRMKGPFIATLQSPLMIPSAVLGVSYLRYLTQLKFYGTLTGLVVCHVIIVMPFALRLVMAAAVGLDRRVEDAAVSLGASTWVTFRRILVPLILPGLASGWILAFITSFDEVTMTVFVASPTVTTLPVKLFLFIQDNINPLVAAVSATLIVMTVLLMVLLDRIYGLERVFAGGDGIEAKK
ncbi:ABC transporter permease [Caballeronia glebae]|uniref:ABC transporter permease n=1 Tax=Caballeronia glebae TaxID=1777143 RepID=UPI0038BD73A0